MYSRPQEYFNMNSSYGKSPNGGFVQGANHLLDTSDKPSGQQMSCLNSNKEPKMNFSIFHGQNSSFQRQPVPFNKDFQQANAHLAEHNPGLSLQQNAFAERQNEQIQQQGSLRNDSNFAQPKSTQMNVSTSSNTLGLMNLPRQNQFFSKPQENALSLPSTSGTGNGNHSTRGYSSRVRRYGETDLEKMCIFTGTVERVIKWGKIFQNQFCYFEVIASVVSIADGKVEFEKTMLLRDKKGPILQVTYYSVSTHINIEDFHLGQMLRAVGRIIGPNVMSAFTIRAATQEEIETLPRMCYVCDHAVSTHCGNSSLLK